MTEQTPQDEAREEEQHKYEPRDAAFWAQRVERLEVSDVPEGAANVNVQGRREVGALQGFGQLWQKTTRYAWPGSRRRPKKSCGFGRSTFPSSSRPIVGSTLRWLGLHLGRCCSSVPQWEVCRYIRAYV